MSTSLGNCVIVGRGRAGRSFAGALASAGWSVELVAARPLVERRLVRQSVTESDMSGSEGGIAESIAQADLVMIAVPDVAIADTALAIGATTAVIVHISGATGLDVLAGHARAGSIHPLMSLPDAETGARRLTDGCTFAVDGDPFALDIVASLGGLAVEVPASNRALYHAAASVAANHLTALCAQVERLAETVGIPIDAYWKMMAATLDNVQEGGASASLTGPAARGDWETVRSHLDALPVSERTLYRALMVEAASIAGQTVPTSLMSDLTPD